MRNLLIKLIVGALTLISLEVIAQTPAASQSQATSPDVALFAWAGDGDIRWGLGALYAGLGVAGALVMMFSLVGGTVPGTKGKARLDADQLRLDGLLEQIENAAMPDSGGSPAVIEALNATADALRDDLNRERWRQFMLAFVLYTGLGAVFAAMLAQGMVQALVFGATWTNLLGAFGLRSEATAQARRKDEAMLEAERVLTAFGADPDGTVSSDEPEAARLLPDVDSVVRGLRRARNT